MTKKDISKERQLKNKIRYRSYLQSPEWQEKRRMVLRYYPKCCRCFSNKGLTVHHASYRRLTEEIPSDLYVLCWSCHGEFHERFGTREGMRKKTLKFIREKNPDFSRRQCMPPDPIEDRTSKRHCKYCNADLVVKKENRKPKRGKKKRSYYYKRTWRCKDNCTYAVTYLFDGDIVYYED